MRASRGMCDLASSKTLGSNRQQQETAGDSAVRHARASLGISNSPGTTSLRNIYSWLLALQARQPCPATPWQERSRASRSAP